MMLMMRVCGSVRGLLWTLLLFPGCSGGDASTPLDLYPATGTVTVDGQPRAGVTVTYVPDADTHGNGGQGVTDASGKYSLTYRDNREGVPAGQYRILLTQMTLPDGSPLPEGASEADVGAVNQLPDTYNNPEASLFTVTITTGTNEPQSLEVKSRR